MDAEYECRQKPAQQDGCADNRYDSQVYGFFHMAIGPFLKNKDLQNRQKLLSERKQQLLFRKTVTDPPDSFNISGVVGADGKLLAERTDMHVKRTRFT